MSEEELESLRDRIDEIDDKIVELLSDRIGVAEDILEIKEGMGRGVRDKGREQKVVEKAREKAVEEGIDPEFAEDIIRLTISRTAGAEQELSGGADMWGKIKDFFEGNPAQLKVARVLYKYGLRAHEDEEVVCGGIRVPAVQIAEEAGVDRRAVHSTVRTILENDELRGIFSNLRPVPYLKGVARHLDLGLFEIIPTDATESGIISEVSGVISKHGLSVRQSITDDPYLTAQPRLTVITNNPISGEVVEDLRDLDSVESVIVY